MRIVAVSEGESLDSYIADDFGHAPFFLIVDSDTLDYHVVVNEFKDAEEGAGFAVARAIADLKVDAVLTGGIGSHGINILRGAGIDVSYDEEGTVEEAVTDYVRRVERRKRFEQQPRRGPRAVDSAAASPSPILPNILHATPTIIRPPSMWTATMAWIIASNDTVHTHA